MGRGLPAVPRRAGWMALAWVLSLMGDAGPVRGQAPPGADDRPDVVIRGRVVDGAGTPIPAALVGLALSNQAVMADSVGRFALPVGRPGRYRLAVEQLGYRATEVWVEPDDVDRPLIIALARDPILLEGLEVTVDRLERRRRHYSGIVRVVDQRELAATSANTAYDVLRRTIPSLRPCPNELWNECVVRRGSVQPLTLCIDERPAWGGRDELEAYTAAELYLVEVYDMGRAARVYTRWYVDNMMRKPRALVPISFGC